MIDEDHLKELESNHSDWCCAKGCHALHTEAIPIKSGPHSYSSFNKVVECPGKCTCETARLLPLIEEIRRLNEVPTEPRVAITPPQPVDEYIMGIVGRDWFAECGRCQGLKADPHPGLFSWVSVVQGHFHRDHGWTYVEGRHA